MSRFVAACACAIALVAGSSAVAATNPCWNALSSAVRPYPGLARVLWAVVVTESDGWPWTITVRGQTRRFPTEAAAAAALAVLARAGETPDCGCWQVSLKHHANRFSGPAACLDPQANTRAALSFLLELRQAFGSWGKAIAAYHSRTKRLGDAYACRVARKLRNIQCEGTP